MLKWEEIITKFEQINLRAEGYKETAPTAYRAKVPGGWLVMVRDYAGGGGVSLTFYPDPTHGWNGSSC